MNQQVDATRGYIENLVNNFINILPRILGVLLILLVGYLVAKALAKLTTKALQAANLDQYLHKGKTGDMVHKAVPRPSKLAGKIVYWVVFLFALSIAVSALGIPVLADFVRAIYGYLPNVVAAILIFIVAGAVSAGVATLAATTMGDTPTGKLVATAAPVIVMGLAVFMILTQLKIAPAIVTLTYAGIVATLTLAFGLGGRDVASQILQGVYEKGKRQSDQATADLRVGAERGKNKANEYRNRG